MKVVPEKTLFCHCERSEAIQLKNAHAFYILGVLGCFIWIASLRSQWRPYAI